jgi:hypothetical protein
MYVTTIAFVVDDIHLEDIGKTAGLCQYRKRQAGVISQFLLRHRRCDKGASRVCLLKVEPEFVLLDPQNNILAVSEQWSVADLVSKS